MTLTVETGAVITDADSFLSLADARTLASNYGVTINSDDTTAEQQLRKAYRYLVDQYEVSLQGKRVSETQTGIFPRQYVYARGFSIASDSIPQDIKLAQVYVAGAIESGLDDNQVKSSADLASFSVDGVYSESYDTSSSQPLIGRVPTAENMLEPYMDTSNSFNYFDPSAYQYGSYRNVW